MSNAVSRGHGRGKPNQDHNVAPMGDQQQQQFVMPMVPPGQMSYGAPQAQMRQYQQYQQPPHQYQHQQHQQSPYYQPQHSAHHNPHHNQQNPYGNDRQYYGGMQVYNQQQTYYPQPSYHSETVNFPPQNLSMQQPPPPSQQPPQEQKRRKNVLSIVDPATQKAIAMPELQTPPVVAAPVVQAPLAQEIAEKQLHIKSELLEKVKKELSANVANEETVKPQPVPVPVTVAAAPPPELPNFSVPPPTVPKTPEAQTKPETVVTSPPETLVTPVSSPQTSDTNSPAMGTAESASTGADVVVTPTLQKDDSKEETDDDKFEENDREQTPDVSESPAEKSAEELAEEKAQKEEEENEKKRLQEQALEKRLEELVAAGEADVSTGTYTRDFMVTLRDIEKMCNRTPCPLTPNQLTDFGLDIKSMRVAEKKPNFTPTWMANKNRPNNNPYRGRTTTDGTGRGGQQRDRGHNKRPPVVRPSIERVQRITLPTSKDAWKPERQKTAVAGNEEETAIRECCKKVRSLMNKVTPTSQKPLTEEFISYNVSSNDTQLAQVVEIVFDKAVEEPKFCALYAEMCRAQANHELSQSKNNQKSAFRNTVLTQTQMTFQGKKDIDDEKMAIIEKEEDPVKRELLMIEERQKTRRRKFGVMTFIGHLFRNQLLSTKIVQSCTYELFASIVPKQTPDKKVIPVKKEDIDEESVHCGLQLIETVGPMFDSKERIFLDQWLSKLDAAKPLCSNKIRFMIMNLIELRKDKWVPRKSTESGPKKIDEIHKDIRQEKLDNEKARDQYDRDRDRRHGGVRTNSNSLRKQGPVSRNSLERNRGMQQQPEQKRAHAAANVKLTQSNVQPKNISLSTMNDSSLGKNKKEWHSGASGGGSTGESAAPKQSAWGRRDSNDQRKKSTIDEKQSALAAAKEIGGSLSARRSTSHNSITDEAENKLSEEDLAKRVKIMNVVLNDVKEVINADLSQKEMVESFADYVGNEKYAKPTLRDVYEMAIRAVSEKSFKDNQKKTLAHVLRLTLVGRNEKQAFIEGVARFCAYAVESELHQDFPNLWTGTADVLMNTMHIPADVIGEEKVEHLSLADMEPVFMAAKMEEEESKKFTLFVQVLKLLTEAEQAETNGNEHLKWELQELPFKAEMEKNGLKDEMDAVKTSNGMKLSDLLQN